MEDWWGTGTGWVRMGIDGHTVSLYNLIDKDKMIVVVLVYVDGYLRSTYSKRIMRSAIVFINVSRKPSTPRKR